MQTRLRTRSASLPLAVATLALLAATGRADVTGSYDGTLEDKKSGENGIVTAGFIVVDRAASGTVSITVEDAAATGIYWVTGKAKAQGRKIKVAGTNEAGTRLTIRAKEAGGTLRGKAILQGASGKRKGALVLAKSSDGGVPAVCDSPFFTGQVMGRVLQPICANCHVPGGIAQATSLRVDVTDPLATQQSVAGHIDTSDPSQSRIVLKPTGQLGHGGGVQVSPGSEEAGILESWAAMAAAGTHCDGAGVPDVAMVPVAAPELLVRAAMDLRGRRPSVAELDRVAGDPAAYGAIVDEYLRAPEFLERVKDVYDDALLVRREDFSDESRDETAAIYGEALELIGWIVANDRPFTEIGTADHTVANALFQRDAARMPFPMEPVAGSAWQPTHYTDGRPHAGLLSTSAFYQVWDTNNTNVNRRRANRWSIVFHCYDFLDTPVDVTRDVDNADANAVLDAVTTRTDCRACHDRLDPMASFLFPLDNARLDGEPDDFFSGDPERWRRANRRPPAVYGRPGIDIRDMGRLLTDDPRFDECQTRRGFELLFQRDPRTNLEVLELARIASAFRAGGHDFRAMVRAWLHSDAYTHRPLAHDPAWVRRASPERLETLVADLTGFTWQREPDDDQDDADPASDPPRTDPVPLLTTEEDGYEVILGGINGESVTARATSLNAPVVIVQRKLAALAAAHVVATDLAAPDGIRRLLQGVTGDEDPVLDADALRVHLARIGRRLYGADYAPGAPEIENWLRLWANLHRDRTEAGAVAGAPAERAWRGVLFAMLRSPRLLLY